MSEGLLVISEASNHKDFSMDIMIEVHGPKGPRSDDWAVCQEGKSQSIVENGMVLIRAQGPSTWDSGAGAPVLLDAMIDGFKEAADLNAHSTGVRIHWPFLGSIGTEEVLACIVTCLAMQENMKEINLCVEPQHLGPVLSLCNESIREGMLLPMSIAETPPAMPCCEHPIVSHKVQAVPAVGKKIDGIDVQGIFGTQCRGLLVVGQADTVQKLSTNFIIEIHGVPYENAGIAAVCEEGTSLTHGENEKVTIRAQGPRKWDTPDDMEILIRAVDSAMQEASHLNAHKVGVWIHWAYLGSIGTSRLRSELCSPGEETGVLKTIVCALGYFADNSIEIDLVLSGHEHVSNVLCLCDAFVRDGTLLPASSFEVVQTQPKRCPLVADEKMNVKERLSPACAGDISETQSTQPSETDLKDGAVNDGAAVPEGQVAKDRCSRVPIKASTTSCMHGLLRPWCCS